MNESNPDKLPRAMHESFLPINDKKLPCAVLDNGIRVLSIGAIYKALGRTKRGRGKGDSRVREMPSFANATNLKPFFEIELDGVREPVIYLSLKGKVVQGYRAEILPALCKAYMNASIAGVVNGKQSEGTLTCLKLATNKRKFDSNYTRAFPSTKGHQGDWIDEM